MGIASFCYIHQIVLEIPEKALKAARTEQAAMNRATQSMATALQALSLAATTAEGRDDMTRGPGAVRRGRASAEGGPGRLCRRLEEEVLPLMKQTTDEIAAQYATGIDFKTPIGRYSTELNDLIDGWQADYEIETHPELLKY